MARRIIYAPVNLVSPLIRNFGSIGEGPPGLKNCLIEEKETGERAGAIRRLDMADAGLIREQRLALSDTNYAATFSIIESALPISNYRSTLSLLSVTDGTRTFIRWNGQFEGDAQDAVVMQARMPVQIYQTAFNNLVSIILKK